MTGKRRSRSKEPAWAQLPDDELLDWRICDLGVKVEGTVLEERIERLHAELSARDIRFRPHYWFSDDWFSPEGVPGVAIPFYLAHPRLARLERSQMLEVEGGTREWCLRILRHEAGHAIDTAYGLHRLRRWQAVFGKSSLPYPDEYAPRPYSKSYVRHLGNWYAQSHPDEDFAETFAVWLKPRSNWRSQYEGWPALKKLEFVAGLLAELRRVVSDPAARGDERAQAARQLARLARAGVPGADPEGWWTTTAASTSEALPAVTALSPSRIEGLLTCPLREVIQRLVVEEETPEAMVRGSLVHAFFEALGRGADADEATALTVAAWESLQKSPAWMRAAEKEAFVTLLTEAAGWLRSRRINYTQVGVEVGVDVEVTDGVRIRGRMDLLDKDSGDRHWIVDLKTSRTAVSHDDAEAHLQLMAYQLALSRGVVRAGKVTDPAPGEHTLDVAGAMLVFPAHTTKDGVAERPQPAKTPAELDEFAAQLPGLLEEMRGPTLTARVNANCDRCPVRTLCPLQPEGKVITRA